MTDSSTAPSSRESARGQTRLLIWVLIVVAAPHLIAQIATVNDWVLLPHRLAVWKATNCQYGDCRFYNNGDNTLRLLNDELPFADYSKGGVYFIGASRLADTLAVWELPAEDRPLIFNYAIGGSTHTLQGQFIRYLVEKHGLLKAGAQKSMIVLDLSFSNAIHNTTLQEGSPPGVWRYGFTMCGLYTCDKDRGVDDVPMCQADRLLHIAYVHDDTFWAWVNNTFRRRPMTWSSIEPHRPAVWRSLMSAQFGPDWARGMDIEVDQLGRTIDYLQAHGVWLAAVYLPVGSWYQDFPPALRYRQSVLALVRAKSVPYIDMAESLGDDRFADSVHLNYVGVHEVRPKLIAFAENFLRSTGALPNR